MGIFNPNEYPLQCEECLSRSLGSRVRFTQAEPLAKSTRDTPWRLDVDVSGAARSYVLRLDSRRGEHEYEVLRAMESVPIHMIVRDQQLVGVIDFETAGFSDPVYEFLLPFFVSPELRGRGIEQRYCRRMGFDPETLFWYHGLEYFDTWHWILETGKPFLHHTADSCCAALDHWLNEA